ncbi:MAG: dockerin type I repeat-containing protein [Phycisphaerae bacterium]|jgi:hypothetical protein
MLDVKKRVAGIVVQGGAWGKFVVCILLLLSSYAYAQLGPQDVVILVNQNSPTSRYIAKMYRQYYPQIADSQVLSLSGLPDSSGPAATPADEILTRQQQYNQGIANPLRAYLADSNYPNRITSVKVIITTAGMPYRIEDTKYADVIYPAGSSPSIVSSYTSEINAASVESELVGLWYADYGSNPFGLNNRLVNPYEGYRYSGFDLFERVVPGTKNMVWSVPISFLGPPPKMEGTPSMFGTINRKFNAGDMYLTARLDGPKKQGQSAIFVVRAMLERARRASSTSYGVNPLQAVAVLDDAPASDLDNNRVFNLDTSANYWVYESGISQPPNAPGLLNKDDYVACFITMTNEPVNYVGLNTGLMGSAYDLCAVLDRRSGVRTSQADLDALLTKYPQRQSGQGAILLATFGRNGDEGSASNYILAGGPGGGPLFNVVNGAVFTSIESYNAVTMFSDVNTAPIAQGKLVDFISIGGTAAIGHSFEPRSTAAIDNLYLFYNLLSDDDGDGKADLTLVEAAFTAIPFLSWSEVLIGDPLMRIAYGPGGPAWISPRQGDVNFDGLINSKDVRILNIALNGQLNSSDPNVFDLYDDRCDFNQDGIINSKDVRILNIALQ